MLHPLYAEFQLLFNILLAWYEVYLQVLGIPLGFLVQIYTLTASSYIFVSCKIIFNRYFVFRVVVDGCFCRIESRTNVLVIKKEVCIFLKLGTV